MEHWSHDPDRAKLKYCEKKPVPVTKRPPQMTQGTGPAEALEWEKGAEEGEEQEERKKNEK